MVVHEQLENALIHYSHARRLGPTEEAPDIHKAAFISADMRNAYADVAPAVLNLYRDFVSSRIPLLRVSSYP